MVNNGYVPYGTYVRDFNPPYTTPEAQAQAIYAQRNSLNVSDPRFSATYGNPYLRQVQTLLWPKNN